MKPNEQLKLLCYQDVFNHLAELYVNNNIPNKILFSGKKGIGKATFAYHFINYILSQNEEDSYNKENNIINANNRSHNLLLNGTHPNFHLIEKKKDKKIIEIQQIREINKFINQSSLNDKLKIVLIDDLEYLTNSASNSLLKAIEEPNKNVQFILIYDNSKFILETLKSRCIEFNFFLKEKQIFTVLNNYFGEDIENQIPTDFKGKYLSPVEYINLISLCNKLNLDFSNLEIDKLIKEIISNNFNNNTIKELDFKLYLEIFLHKKCKNINNLKYFNFTNKFNKKFSDAMKYNLDIQPLLIELNSVFFK